MPATSQQRDRYSFAHPDRAVIFPIRPTEFSTAVTAVSDADPPRMSTNGLPFTTDAHRNGELVTHACGTAVLPGLDAIAFGVCRDRFQAAPFPVSTLAPLPERALGGHPFHRRPRSMRLDERAVVGRRPAISVRRHRGARLGRPVPDSGSRRARSALAPRAHPQRVQASAHGVGLAPERGCDGACACSPFGHRARFGAFARAPFPVPAAR